MSPMLQVCVSISRGNSDYRGTTVTAAELLAGVNGRGPRLAFGFLNGGSRAGHRQ